jgi:hypothetical protein
MFLEAQVDGEWLAGIDFTPQSHTHTADNVTYNILQLWNMIERCFLFIRGM